MDSDLLAGIVKPSPKTDRRLERRMMLTKEWQWMYPVTEDGAERYGMIGHERVLLYILAIQTGLRSAELRSLTRGKFHLNQSPPFVICKAVSTKNEQDCHQYIKADLAMAIKVLLTTKAPKTPVFRMPRDTRVADMFRADLADARAAWLEQAQNNPQDYAQRQDSDFLAAVNYEGEVLDFHSLHHTCGAWLALTGAHVKAV